MGTVIPFRLDEQPKRPPADLPKDHRAALLSLHRSPADPGFYKRGSQPDDPDSWQDWPPDDGA